MELRDVMRTTAAVRDFTPEPVDDAELAALVDDARFAPSGGNRQPWRLISVRDPALRRQLADLQVPIWAEYVAQKVAGETPFSVVADTSVDLDEARRGHMPNPYLDGIEDVPAVLVACVDLTGLAVLDKDTDRIPLAPGGSVFPFLHNVLLAARNRGLGGVITTLISRAEPQAKALLGVPAPWAVAAMVFLGHPVKQVTKLSRKPVEELLVLDRFDGDPIPAG